MDVAKPQYKMDNNILTCGLVFLLLMTGACDKKQAVQKVSKIDSNQAKASELSETGTVQKNKNDTVREYNPSNEENLKWCIKKVINEADPYYYTRIDDYYCNATNFQKKGLAKKMIKYTEIMIRYHKRNESYKLLYYFYVKEADLPNKKQLMKTAIKYLKEVAKDKTNSIINISNAMVDLSEIYREGTYVKRDTVMANYLYNNSDKATNLDSLIKARNYKE